MSRHTTADTADCCLFGYSNGWHILLVRRRWEPFVDRWAIPGGYVEPGEDSDVLVPVAASSNRSKGDQDPATWLPEQDRCGYATTWIQIKQRYELTVDQAEAEAIRGVLTRC